MERLSGLDAAFLYMETPTQHMHVCGTLLLRIDEAHAADAAGRRVAASRAGATMAARLACNPAFRRRVVEAPFGLLHPSWITAGDFRPAAHVRWSSVPEPGTLDQFADIVGRIAATPLSRTAPLWELWMVEGIEGDRVGAVLKMHHAIVDGVSGLGVLADLATTDLAGDPPRIGVALCDPPETSGAVRLAVSGLAEWALTPLKLAGTLARTLPALVRGAVELTRRASRPALLFSTPRTALNRALTGERAVAFGRTPLESVKRIKNAFGVTVNDVVLAACSLALRDYLGAHGELPSRALVASVPVSEHTPGEAAGSVNRVSAMFVGMPVHLAAPDAVLRAVHEQTLRAKNLYSYFGSRMLEQWAELAPPGLFASAAGLYSRWKLADHFPPIHSIVISNVPGPPEPLYVGGLLLDAAYPLGPVLEGAGINISVVSYAGSIDIGLIACPRAIEHPAELARGFEAAIARLEVEAGACEETSSVA